MTNRDMTWTAKPEQSLMSANAGTASSPVLVQNHPSTPRNALAHNLASVRFRRKRTRKSIFSSPRQAMMFAAHALISSRVLGVSW